MQLFSADVIIFLKKLRIVLAHENTKKLPSKVANLWQFGFFFLCSPDCPKQPRIENSYQKCGPAQDTSVYYSVVKYRVFSGFDKQKSCSGFPQLQYHYIFYHQIPNNWANSNKQAGRNQSILYINCTCIIIIPGFYFFKRY